MSEKRSTERLTVDLDAEEKRKLRVITAIHGEKHMQTMVRRLIVEAYDKVQVGSISSADPKPIMNFRDENARNLNT